MSIEFRNVSSGPLKEFTATAPNGAIIGVVGGKNRLRSSLVVAQVAGSLTLLIIAGLFTRSLGKAQQTSLGFNPSHLLNMTMDPNEIGYNDLQYREFYKNLL